MTDILSKEERHQMMSRIKSSNTEIEKRVFEYLVSLGLEFQTHLKSVAGCPDAVLVKQRIVIFVHGCFWHRHRNCRLAYHPKSNIEFWNRKFEQNLMRDIQVQKSLLETNWSIFTVWQCEVENGVFKQILLEGTKQNG